MKTTEKRTHLRIPTSRPLICIINHQTVYATMTDFSQHGVGFITTETLPANTMIEVHFDIPVSYQNKQVKAFQFKALIKHCLGLHESNHIGAKLDLPSEEYKSIFDQLSA